jgi:hypothetical protein
VVCCSASYRWRFVRYACYLTDQLLGQAAELGLPVLAANALDEWVDQVAANKIIAFGGDVRGCVEKVYGHLTLAKEVVAAVLGRRIERGWIHRPQALELARRWFLENPAELYGVPSVLS